MRLRDEDRLTPDLVFRDPYVLDFLQLQDSYSEKDLEAAILREIEAFILELGVGFTLIVTVSRPPSPDLCLEYRGGWGKSRAGAACVR